MSMTGNCIAITPDQLESLLSDPSQVVPFIYPRKGASGPTHHVDLDKAWHAIHFMLNGEAWTGTGPLFLPVLGGKEIGEDAGYGPARFLRPSEVKEAALALAAIDSAAFSDRFDPVALADADIYPGIWDEDEEALEYVAHYYAELRSFYAAAAERGDAVLNFVN